MLDVDIPRVAHPRRDIPDEDPAVARQSAMLLALLSELTVMRERVDTIERLLIENGALQADAIESYEPDAAAEAERTALRTRQIAKVLRPLQADAMRAAAAARANARSNAEADDILAKEIGL